MRLALAAAAGLALASAGTAADPLMTFKPIDTSKYVVGPTDQAVGIVAGASQTLSRTAAGQIESNGIVRTINNLFGKKATAPPVQVNGIPAPSLYPSTSYPSVLSPRMPTASQYR